MLTRNATDAQQQTKHRFYRTAVHATTVQKLQWTDREESEI